MHKAMDKNSADTLEGFIDLFSLSEVLGQISLICVNKAKHVAEVYMDTETAKTWEWAASVTERASVALEKKNV